MSHIATLACALLATFALACHARRDDAPFADANLTAPRDLTARYPALRAAVEAAAVVGLSTPATQTPYSALTERFGTRITDRAHLIAAPALRALDAPLELPRETAHLLDDIETLLPGAPLAVPLAATLAATHDDHAADSATTTAATGLVSDFRIDDERFADFTLDWPTTPAYPARFRDAVEKLFSLARTLDYFNEARIAALSPALRDDFATLLEHYSDPEDAPADAANNDPLKTHVALATAFGKPRMPPGVAHIAKRFLAAARAVCQPDVRDEAARAMARHHSVFTLPTGVGAIRIGGATSDLHDASAFLTIDLGGDDIWLTRNYEPRERPVTLSVECTGNDAYLSQKAGSWGAGILGIGLHVDFEGDDHYRAKDLSLGTGVGGLGLLYDLGGDDRYVGGALTQGAALYGFGALIDTGGDDEYRARGHAQAYAGPGGLAALHDASGRDTYLLHGLVADDARFPETTVAMGQGAAWGPRHVTQDPANAGRLRLADQVPGGIALLFDGAGDDRYFADSWAQGVGYWLSLGALIDLTGNDLYRGFWYAQGASAHGALGLLWDTAGDDRYEAEFSAQGMGHDRGTGILLDEHGNDLYRSGRTSQGVGNGPVGVGLLFDGAGDDRYTCDFNGQGRASEPFSEAALPAGLLFDASGTDHYTRGDIRRGITETDVSEGEPNSNARRLDFPLAQPPAKSAPLQARAAP